MIRRIKKGKKFIYESASGTSVSLPPHLAGLRIPPAWTEVLLNPDPLEKIYVTGFDKKGRKQYLYNPAVLEKNNQKKFRRLRWFLDSLPYLRSQVTDLIRLNRWNKDKVLALAVKILDELSIRVGNECYRKENGSYGLTTLEKRHLKCSGNHMILSFRGKSGKDHDLVLEDPSICKLLKRLRTLPGEKLFVYKDNKGNLRPLKPDDVNAFLREISNGKITAKDFRTWKGTVLAIKEVMNEEDQEQKKRKKLITRVVSGVSKALGNTVAICRNYYIHPQIIKMLEDESLPGKIAGLRDKTTSASPYLSLHESLAARLLFRL